MALSSFTMLFKNYQYLYPNIFFIIPNKSVLIKQELLYNLYSIATLFYFLSPLICLF